MLTRLVRVIPAPHKYRSANRPKQRKDEDRADDPDLKRGQSCERQFLGQCCKHPVSIAPMLFGNKLLFRITAPQLIHSGD